MQEIIPISWENDALHILDQTKLPEVEEVIELTHYEEVIEAIQSLRVRGAPAIGVAAGYGMAIAAKNIDPLSDFMAEFKNIASKMIAARPTAVNLSWAVNQMIELCNTIEDTNQAPEIILKEAIAIHQRDEAINRQMGNIGKEVLVDVPSVLTHCNTGALATSGYGTAFGVIRAGIESGLAFSVFNTETRPFYQGSRLTSWEFKKLGVDSTLVVDSAAGSLMNQGKIGCVITGADRIAANGDSANKIGTYSLAVLAKENEIPFYIAAPTSTIDMSLESGSQIDIEYRDQAEITHHSGTRIAPEGVSALNPSFDVTPAKYISGIITEKAICRPPYDQSIANIM